MEGSGFQKSGSVAARMCEARDHPGEDRITQSNEHDRDRTCVPLQVLNGRRIFSDHHIGIDCNKFCRRGAHVDAEVAAVRTNPACEVPREMRQQRRRSPRQSEGRSCAAARPAGRAPLRARATTNRHAAPEHQPTQLRRRSSSPSIGTSRIWLELRPESRNLRPAIGAQWLRPAARILNARFVRLGVKSPLSEDAAVECRFTPNKQTPIAKTGERRLVPTADHLQRSSRGGLFDHLVGATEERERDGQSERPGSLEVEDQARLSWTARPGGQQASRPLRMRPA